MALQEEFEVQGNWLFKYRGTLPLIPLFIAILLFLWTKLHPETFFLSDSHYAQYFEYLCLLVSLFGLGIRMYAVGHTPNNTSGRNTEQQVADVLNTTGIYSTVRHPLYLGNFFMWLGPAMLTGQFWFIIAFCLFYWVYYERIMFAEEQYLRKKFGKGYTDWAEKLPAFIPSLKGFKKPDTPMNWKKIIKNEKNGIVAIFIIFAFFNVTGELIQNKTNYNYYFIYLAAFSLLMYLVIKFLIKKTTILNDTRS